MKNRGAHIVDDLRCSDVMIVIIELLMLAAWTLFVTAPYLNLDADVVPTGREYLSAIQTHHVWTQMQQCGLCALWNGSERGGAPAFADVHGSMLHPVVILTTLIWGVINGSKIALVVAFFGAGLAQWWLARVLRLHPLTRLWSAAMAVAAGNLAGRMELGAFGVVLSTAMCTLVLPPLVALNQNPTRRAAVQLGIVLALAMLAGQGYMQVGLAFVLPAALWLMPVEDAPRRLIVRRYGLAIVIACLLAAPLLVPFLHFIPNFVKEVDPQFRSAQSLAYIPLNLVVDNYAFYNSDVLDKYPYPHLYVNYIGWVPVVLAIIGIFGAKDQFQRRTIGFLLTFGFLAMWVSSAEPLIWLARLVPIRWIADQLDGIRHSPQIAGLAVPAILALAAMGLDRLLTREWPQIRLTQKSSPEGFTFDTALLLIVPLAFALTSAQSFGSLWIRTTRLDPNVRQLLAGLQTPDLQWVNPPFGEHFYIEPAVALGLKMHFGIRTWNWRNRELPEPVLEANLAGAPPGMVPFKTVANIPIYIAPPGREYAAVTHADGARTICSAHGTGGDIDVDCDLMQAGILIVKENSWEGWLVSGDGKPLTLKSGQWLSVDLPVGKQTIQFRYRPWDVALGVLLCIAGIVLATQQWMTLD